jgi:hypothetical protein
MLKRVHLASASILLLGAAAGAAVFGPSVIGHDDENETPISGDALTKATEAALAHTGGGRVTETEVGDEDSYYEVEVTLGDGRQVDVQLDEDFKVVSSESDDEGEGEADD